jgi:3-hydroxy-3-methylglutaryl CoA synthase
MSRTRARRAATPACRPSLPSSLAGPDEDALTLAVSAEHSMRQDCSRVGSLGLASTSLLLARGVQAGLIVDALGIATDTLVTEHTTSSRAATEAPAGLVALVRATGPRGLIVAAETPSPGDLPCGS